MKYTQGQSVQKIVEGGDSLWIYTDDTATVVVTPENVSANAVTTTVDRTDGVVKYGPYYKPTVVNVTATSLDADVRNYEFIANPTTEGEFGEIMAATGGMTPSEIGKSIVGVRKCVVIFGSSNGAGVGASDFSAPSLANGWSSSPKSWAGLLEAEVLSRDSEFEFFNRSISGTDTNDSVSRFFSDVAPHKPSHVILCTAIGNEAYDITSYLKNTATLIKYCLQIGATPILRGTYPKNGMTANNYKVCQIINSSFEGFGYPVIDHMTILDDGAGQFYGGSSYNSDGTHLNDAGQVQFFRCIEPEIFTADYSVNNKADCAGQLATGTTTDRGLRVHTITGMSAGVYSCAARVRFNTSATPSDVRLMAFYGGFGYDQCVLAISASSEIVLFDSDNTTALISTGVTVSASTDYDVTVSINYPQEKIDIIVNGSVVGSLAITPTFSDMTAVTLCGKYNSTDKPPIGYKFYDAEVYRSPKYENFARQVYAGKDVLSSKIYAADFAATVGDLYVPNLIKNGLLPTIENHWESVRS